MKNCKHKFEPRYDEILPAEINFGGGYGGRTFIEALKTKKYIYDICVRCGKIIKRNNHEMANSSPK
jgi:hypothetical protein